KHVIRSLHEIIRAQNLAIGEKDLLSLILDTAVRTTGADKGSLMLLDRADNLLKIRVARGIEEELWPKIRFPLGEGIAGKVAQEGLPRRISGKADSQDFHLLRDRDDLRSALCVPLTVDANVFGVLNVSSTCSGKEFTDEDLQFLTELAELEAQIIFRSEEVRELRDNVARFKTDRQLNQVLASVLPLADRLSRACALIQEWVPGASCAIYIPDESGGLVQRASAPEMSRASAGVQPTRETGIEQWVQSEGKAVILRDDPGSLAGPAPGRKAYAVLPLLAGDKNVGILTVQVVSPKGLEAAQERILREAAEPIAEAVETSLREESITRYATKVGAINEAGLRLLGTPQLDELVKLVTSSAGMILQCDACVLRLRDASSGRYMIRSYFGSGDTRLQKGLFSFDKQFVIRLLRRKEPVLITDIREDKELSEDNPAVRTALGVPLRHPHGTLGTLAVYDKLVPSSFYPVPFTHEDREVLVRYAGFVEKAILQATIAERSRRNDQTDDATGLPNRAFLDRRMRDELERAQRTKRKIGLMTCRVGNHAEFAERAGEEAGRRLMLKISETLRENLRGFDVVARIDALAFGILFPEPGLDAKEAIARLSVSVNDAIQADLPADMSVTVHLEYGYAFYPEDGETAEALWEKAQEIRIRAQ
ncbi:MAG: GAF domain-containing protein, partial [Myxococcota bacterium]